MPSLITLRTPPPAHDAPPWALDVVPYTYDEASRVQLLAMPGVRWVKDTSSPNSRGFYRGPREGVEIVAGILERAGAIKVRREAMTPLGLDDSHTHMAPAAFRHYQVAGATWLRWMCLTEGGALLADEMGIGKSAQAIAALDALAPTHALVICPAIVRPHWGAQFERWASTSFPRTVLSYEGFVAAKKKGALPAASHLVIDEGHYTSNPKAQRSKAIAEWLAAQPTRPQVIMLSGTPMTARPRDLWHPLDLIHPGRWGTKWAFEKRYCGGRFEEIPNTEKSVWVADGVSHADELAARLRAVMLRRTKLEVGAELPPRTRIVHEVEIPAKAAKSLSRAAAAIDWREGGKGLVTASISSLLSGVEEYKLEAAEALARDIAASGGRVLLLTTRKESARRLGDVLRCPSVTGDDDVNERHARLVDAPVGVATLYSVTTGIDLVGYDNLIFVGLDWVPSTIAQGEARIHRLGQPKPVTIYYLVGRGTLDEVVRERVIERLETFGTIVGDEASNTFAAELGGAEEDLIAAMVAAVSSKSRRKAA